MTPLISAGSEINMFGDDITLYKSAADYTETTVTGYWFSVIMRSREIAT